MTPVQLQMLEGFTPASEQRHSSGKWGGATGRGQAGTACKAKSADISKVLALRMPAAGRRCGPAHPHPGAGRRTAQPRCPGYAKRPPLALRSASLGC